MSIFKDKKEYSSEEFKEILRRDRGNIPGGGKFFEHERKKLFSEVFGSRYGSRISKDDFRRAISDLERKMKSTSSDIEKRNFQKKIDYLKRIGGF